tara:strand:+ start:1352 stop:2263 length:912 start_codon:yes stop_codon:yes gene_type:complete
MENKRKTLKSKEELQAHADPQKRAAVINAIHELKPPPSYARSKKKKDIGKTILVVPDSHAKVGVPNHRYEWLGRLATDIQPDHIVDIGDWFDMHSMNGYDKPGSRSFRGASYWNDIEIGLDARLRFKDQIDTYNRGRRKEYRYEPELTFCVGNHEQRISRFIEEEPRFEGVISLDDLRSEELGWEQVPFLDIKNIEGCNFSHYFTSGVMSRPISGMHQAASLLTKRFETCIQGHTHTYDHSVKSTASRHIHGLVVGCFFEHEESWAGPANHMWRRGLCVLRNVKMGDFDVEWWSLERIKSLYS